MNTEENTGIDDIMYRIIIWPFILSFFAVYFIFPSVSMPIKQLLGYNALILVAFSFIVYLLVYLSQLKRKDQKGIKKELSIRILFNSLLLSVIYTGAMLMLALGLVFIITEAYPGASVIRIGIALTGAATATVASYLAAQAAENTNAVSITKSLTLFMFGGLLISAITNSNPTWYTESFSYLGVTPSIAAQIFNFTMTFTGLGAIVLSGYLFKEFEESIPDKEKFKKSEKIFKWMFWVLGAGIAVVGLIPWDPGIKGQIHTLGATFSGLIFFVFSAFSRKFLPGMQNVYYLITYMLATIVAGTYVIFMLGKNTLATVEIIAFISVYIWIFVTLKALELNSSTK